MTDSSHVNTKRPRLHRHRPSGYEAAADDAASPIAGPSNVVKQEGRSPGQNQEEEDEDVDRRRMNQDEEDDVNAGSLQRLQINDLLRPVPRAALERLLRPFGPVARMVMGETCAVAYVVCSVNDALRAAAELDCERWMDNVIRVKVQRRRRKEAMPPSQIRPDSPEPEVLEHKFMGRSYLSLVRPRDQSSARCQPRPIRRQRGSFAEEVRMAPASPEHRSNNDDSVIFVGASNGSPRQATPDGLPPRRHPWLREMPSPFPLFPPRVPPAAAAGSAPARYASPAPSPMSDTKATTVAQRERLPGVIDPTRSEITLRDLLEKSYKEKELQEALDIQEKLEDKARQREQLDLELSALDRTAQDWKTRELKALLREKMRLKATVREISEMQQASRAPLEDRRRRLTAEMALLAEQPGYRSEEQIELLTRHLEEVQTYAEAVRDVLLPSTSEADRKGCPICFEMAEQVFSCVHCENWFCGRCRAGLGTCPSCREDFAVNPSRRNKGIERVLGI